GGMPSSHSALVVSLTTIIGRLQGVQSPLFATALIFSTVVMYDATGVRRAAGQQAIILNRLLDDLFIAHRGIHQERLRELLGHTPIEVISGALLGIVVGFGLGQSWWRNDAGSTWRSSNAVWRLPENERRPWYGRAWCALPERQRTSPTSSSVPTR